MASISWLGRAKKTADVWTLTVTGPVIAGELWNVVINGKTIQFEATAGTTGNVVAGLVALLTDSDAPAEFLEADWVDDDPAIVMTAKTEYHGVPIGVSVSTDSGTGTFVAVNTVAATGPENASATANYSGGALPSDGDSLFFGAAEYGPKYNLNALASITPALIDIAPEATYEIGLPKINKLGSYTEYRTTHMQFDGCTLFRVRDGNTSQLLRFNFLGAVAVAAVVENTGSSSESNAPTLDLLGSEATNSLDVLAGSVGIAALSNETATWKTITQAGGTITAGPGATLGGSGSAITIGGGTFHARSACVTVTVESGGTFNLNDSATVTTLTVETGGAVNYRSSGTITTANVKGSVNFTDDRSGRTVTTLNLFPGASLSGLESVTITTLAKNSAVLTMNAA